MERTFLEQFEAVDNVTEVRERLADRGARQAGQPKNFNG